MPVSPLSRDELSPSDEQAIEAALAAVCRRHRLTADDADELRQRVYVKLCEQGVLRKFQNRSTLRTFLVTVCERVLLDWRISEWGKWRPCQEAKRLGPLAIELDRLLTRDHLPYEEAVDKLLTQGHAAKRSEIDAIRPKLAERTRRWMVSHEVLEHMPASGSADEHVMRQEHNAKFAAIGVALANVLRALAPQDQLLLRMRFESGFTVARIAEAVGEDQKPLYRRFERLLVGLKTSLAQLGIGEDEVKDLLRGCGSPDDDGGEGSAPPASPPPTGGPGTPPRRPSTTETPGGRHA